MLVLLNAIKQQQSPTAQTCICINITVSKCLNWNRASKHLKASKKDADIIFVSLFQGFSLRRHNWDTQHLWKYHAHSRRSCVLQSGVDYIFILVYTSQNKVIINAFCRHKQKYLYWLSHWAAFVLRNNSADLEFNTVQSFIAALAFQD